MTPKELEDLIKTSFHSTGLKPTFNQWTEYQDGIKCGCAITSGTVYLEIDTWNTINENINNIPSSSSYPDLLLSRFAEEVGLSKRAVWSFIDGFDRWYGKPPHNGTFKRAGYNVATWARAMLNKEQELESV